MYILFVGEPTFIMILNQIVDIFWQTAAPVTNGTTTSARTFKLTFSGIKSITCNDEENKLYENENKGLSVEDLCGEIRYFQNLGCGNISLA